MNRLASRRPPTRWSPEGSPTPTRRATARNPACWRRCTNGRSKRMRPSAGSLTSPMAGGSAPSTAARGGHRCR